MVRGLGAVVLIFNPLLPDAEDICQRQFIDFAPAVAVQRYRLPLSDAGGRPTPRCGWKQQHFEAEGGVTVWVQEGEDVPFSKPQGCSRVPSQANGKASGCCDGDDRGSVLVTQ